MLVMEPNHIPWLGCDYQNWNGVESSYCVHAMCMGFPDPADKTFKNIAVNSQTKETSLSNE